MMTPRVDTVVRGGKVVTASDIFEAAVAIKGGKIAAIGPEDLLPPADRVIDAGGRFVLPGLIDCHLHVGAEYDDWKTAPLAAVQRDRLVAAMGVVERLLTAGMVEIRPADPTHPDARFCLRSYFAELDRRSDSGFDPAQGISAEPHELRPPAGLLLVGYLRSEAIGCGAVKHRDDAPSEIKRMWVTETARGLGIGRRLLIELEAWAARRGARAVRLETNRALTEAIGLYRSAGYLEVPAFNDEPFAHHWFEKSLG
jgi:GNAT superfamily N-acetyltransferase